LIFACSIWLAGLVFVSERTSPRAITLNDVQGNKRKQRIDPVVITLHPTGFEPKEITRSRGLFLLVVNNRSNNPDVLLRLDRETGQREHEERVKGGKLDWRKPFDLHPGRYLLSEAYHPGWICRITITEQRFFGCEIRSSPNGSSSDRVLTAGGNTMVPITAPTRPIRANLLSHSLALVTALTLFVVVAKAQTSATDGTTPAALAPGAPAGSYSLS
jgi:hypothetical protein